jgi:hypothetical protein
MKNYTDYTSNDIRKAISRFKNDENLSKLNSIYQSKSFSEILGVSRKEIPHSRFLSWVLNPFESHKFGFFTIKKFLDILVLMANQKSTEKYKQLFNDIITDDIKIDDVLIESEKSIFSAGRVDIYIKLSISNKDYKNLEIVIENKVSANETNDQTNRYFEYFEKTKNADSQLLYVYLTPLSTLQLIEMEEAQCNCKEFIQINYQILVDKMFEPIFLLDVSSKTKFIIREYLQSLSQPSLDDSSKIEEGLIMAIGNEERELLTKFWNNNEKLILASLYAISSDPDQDADVRDSINEALENISNSSKDRSLINIKHNEKVIVSSIKKSDIGLQTVMILNNLNLINDEVFEFLRNDKSSSFNLLKHVDEISDNERKYRKYKVNDEPEIFYQGQGYYIARNWGIGNIGKLINKIQNKFPEIKYEIK